MLQAFIIFGLEALLAGNISGFLKNHTASGLVLKWVQIVVFVGIGVFYPDLMKSIYWQGIVQEFFYKGCFLFNLSSIT